MDKIKITAWTIQIKIGQPPQNPAGEQPYVKMSGSAWFQSNELALGMVKKRFDYAKNNPLDKIGEKCRCSKRSS